MKFNPLKSAALASLACLVAVSSLGSSAYAVTQRQPANNNNAGQALEISPPVINLTADPGKTVTTQISLRDVSTSKLIVQGQVNDFVAAGEDGTPKIITEETEEADPYSLKSWVSPLPRLTLEPRQIRNLNVTIKVPENAAPGGYYGVIRFTATPPELESTGVSLSASLGALVLLRVNGDTKEELSIEEFSVSKDDRSGTLFESTPVTFIERLKNTGNIHVQPTGQVTVKDMFGKDVAKVNVNLQARNALPQSIRKFDQTLDSSVIGDKKLFGRYTATLSVKYGNSQKTLEETVTFWVVPYRLIIGGVVLLVAGFFLLRFLVKRYNQNIINRAQGSSRPKKKK